MPRIRKQTSRRGTTHQREKIKHKAAETRKKRKKETKKNPQWKSKHKKDPGIPNNFPYKDQILAEVAEERRQAEEAKQRKKDLKKALKAGATEEVVVDSENEGSETEAYDGVSAVHSGKATAAASRRVKAVVAAAEEEDDDVPILMSSELSSLKDVLEAADVVVEVLNARDPLAYHSSHLAELVKAKEGQKLLLVLNKIDGSSREAVSAWADRLRAQHPTLLFRSASAFLPSLEPIPAKGKGKERADDALGLDSVLSLLGEWAQEKPSDGPLAVAVIGVTNVGKSSFVNSLVRRAAVSVYQLNDYSDGPSTTTYAQEVTLDARGKTIRLIDTPGFSWWPKPDQSADEAGNARTRDILTRNRGRIERLKDPQQAVHQIVSRASTEDLMLFYNLPAFAEKDSIAFLSALARANGLVKKGGVLDVTGASRIVLRDWSTGKFPWYTVPNPQTISPLNTSLASHFANDGQILSAIPTRKELRKGRGIVKLIAADADSRQLALQASWIPSEGGGDGGEEAEEGINTGEEDADGETDDEGEEVEVEVEDSNNEEDENADDESEEELPPKGKRKRTIETDAVIARPKKKVTFSTEPIDTKQARKAAGARGSLLQKIRATAAPAPTAVKPAIKATKVKPTLVATKKVANSGPSRKSVSTGAGEAYDFRKFF